MSEKKTQQKKPSFFARLQSWFIRVFVLSFKNMYAELKLVSWPSRKDLFNYAVIVISFMVVMAVVIGVLDLGTTALLKAIIKKG